MSSLGIIHFSDLHIGESPSPAHSRIPYKRRANAHDWILAKEFQRMHSVVKNFLQIDQDDLYFVMSGDLTANGGYGELVNGHTYIQGRWETSCPANQVVGLNFDLTTNPPPLLKIPGNHDQWDGKGWRRGRGFNPRNAGIHFADTPWIKYWQTSDFLIQIIGIDSCSGLSSKWGNASSSGSFDLSPTGELEQLKQLLSTPSPKTDLPVFRVLVVHHSLACQSSLDKLSRDELLDMARQYQIGVFLTGHTHDAFVWQLDDPGSNGSKLNSWEFRSASTLQGPHDRSWHSPPGFLVHKLELEEHNGVSQLRWTCHRFAWDAAQHFFRCDPTDKQSSGGYKSILVEPV